MKDSLLELITELSLKDTKTLSQKGLKLSDEVGDLAKRILAYENADGARHHVFYKQDILEECADVILVAMSIALSQGHDSDALYSMMEDKAVKWSGLKELDKSDGRYPFEIHLTVDHFGQEQDFLDICKFNDIKPIFLDLEGETQITTASVVYGSATEALATAHNLKDYFNMANMDVTRVKIETVPWHPMTVNFLKNNYFESHFTFIADDERMELIRDHCRSYGVHMSRNKLRHTVDGMNKFMGTLRSYTTLLDHQIRIDDVLKRLNGFGITPQKTITEYAFYDSNKELDDKWMNIKRTK